jgi:uncharacterized protein involved in response to NO
VGWWPIYPALQHPRLLIFGFGAAFLYGFLTTAWPRFLESSPLNRFEVILLVTGWTLAQLAYAKALIAGGDLLSAATGCLLLLILTRRLFEGGRDLPPPGFALAFLSVGLGVTVLFAWGFQVHLSSPNTDYLLRLLGYQGFLLLPILGVGSYLFPRFFEEKAVLSRKRRAAFVWLTALCIIGSFLVEVYVSVSWGNLLRLLAVLSWTGGLVPALFRGRGAAQGTRPWAVRVGFLMLGAAFLTRAILPQETFAFEHLLFLCGFSQLILLVADRVVAGHYHDCVPSPKSRSWQWIVWLMLLTAATRATADLVPSTRISHHIYAAVMLIVIFVIWGVLQMRKPRGEIKKE